MEESVIFWLINKPSQHAANVIDMEDSQLMKCDWAHYAMPQSQSSENSSPMSHLFQMSLI